MADAKSNAFTATTPEERLERLLHTCRRMTQNLDQLICALSIVDDVIPDRDDAGMRLSSLVQLLITHQHEEYADFAKEVMLAAGEAA